MDEGNNILAELETAEQAALKALTIVQDEGALSAWKTAHLGRSAAVMQVFSKLGQVDKALRGQVGQRANQVKVALEAALAEKEQAVRTAAVARKLASEKLDVTLPGRQPAYGRLHPATLALEEICRNLAEMGFQIYRSPEVETEENNFELINIPAYHPARDMWDTFYTTQPEVILRTHTSPGQIRAMREYAPKPMRVILPGMVYRYEQTDASHESQFDQVELIAVGPGITFGDLKGTIEDLAHRMFGPDVRIRLRPSYFPFTEPSGEIDMECFICGGKGCAVCKGGGWLEIGGCGMMHPTVLQNGGYDPAKFSGFAAGLGPERIAMLKYRIEDIRYFWGNDARFLEQF
jgi:phenylalanyl-tRNA synthetase alpha chain